MKFNPDIERREHPQARLIPQSIWDSYFKDEAFVDTYCQLMTLPQETIVEFIGSLKKEHQTHNGMSELKAEKKLFFCLFYRENPLNDELLFELLQHLVSTVRGSAVNREFHCLLQQTQTAMSVGNTLLIDELIETSRDNTPRINDCIRKALPFAAIHDQTHPILQIIANNKKPTEPMIKALQATFVMAIKKNQLKALSCFFTLEQHLLEKVIRHDNNEVIKELIIKDNLVALSSIVGQINKPSVEAIICKDDGQILVRSNPMIFNYLLSLFAHDEIIRLIRHQDYGLFRNAAKNLNINLMKQLTTYLTPDEIRIMISANEFESCAEFTSEIYQYSKNIIDKEQIIIQMLDFFIKQMRLEGEAGVRAVLSAQQYSVFTMAANLSWTKVLKHCLSLADRATQQDMLSLNNYHLFKCLAEAGNIALIEHFLTYNPSNTQLMIKAGNYHIFSAAKTRAKDNVMLWLLDSADLINTKNMIALHDYAAFNYFAKKGNLKGMGRLIQLVFPDDPFAMISANNWTALTESSSTAGRYEGYYAPVQPVIPDESRLDVIQFIMKQLAKRGRTFQQEMLALNHYHLFKDAAAHHHAQTLRYLMSILSPNTILNMITANHHAVFIEVLHGKDLDMIKYMMSCIPYEQHLEIATNLQSSYQRYLHSLDHLKDIGQEGANILLKFYPIFDYAEKHAREYGQYTKHFANHQINALKKMHQNSEILDPNGVFDILDPNEARLYFYIIRYLIRRNHVSDIETIQRLIEIPSVRLLLHTAITPNNENELIRFALQQNNMNAAQILLTVRAVRELAEANHFYQAEAMGAFDLRAMAQDHESSMTGLSTDEQRRLKSALDYYEPKIRERGGVEAVMALLQRTLVSRYEAKPIQLELKNGEKQTLSMDLREQQTLIAQGYTLKQIKEVYHSHKDHTAWRYLSKPNHWMHENASYVCIDSSRTLRWSTFKDYMPLISMLFLAAMDDTDDPRVKPCDGYTLETRLEHFIDELAHIGRAHNWDKKRTRTNELGVVITEEYDDGEGDKPSCFSGVKRRLFQSVLGHPLLKMLTQEDIKQFLRDFVRSHFKSTINTSCEKEKLSHAWTAACEFPDEKALQTLRVMNASQEQQTDFIRFLSEHPAFGTQFRQEISFHAYITNRLSDTCHATAFGGETNLTQLFELALSNNRKRKRSIGFFEEGADESSEHSATADDADKHISHPP